MDDAARYAIPGFSDPISSLSHLAGALICLGLTFPLLRRAGGHGGRIVFLGVFAFSCVLLLSMSGVYHLLPLGGTTRAVFLRLDHGAIFVLIAGSFTPIHGILFTGLGRWVPLLLIWAAAIAALTLKTVFFEDLPLWLGLSLYLGLGWLGLASGGVLWYRYGTAFIRPLLLGGLAYTAGAVLEFLDWPTVIPGVLGPHELFHLAVLAGVGLHWAFIFRFAGGAVPSHTRPQAVAIP